MATAEFLQVHCTNTDTPACSGCARDFIVPISAVSHFAKSGNVAMITFQNTNFCFDPNYPEWTRYMKTEMTWADLVNELDGELSNLGNMSLSFLHKPKV